MALFQACWPAGVKAGEIEIRDVAVNLRLMMTTCVGSDSAVTWEARGSIGERQGTEHMPVKANGISNVAPGGEFYYILAT